MLFWSEPYKVSDFPHTGHSINSSSEELLFVSFSGGNETLPSVALSFAFLKFL